MLAYCVCSTFVFLFCDIYQNLNTYGPGNILDKIVSVNCSSETNKITKFENRRVATAIKC